MPDPSQDWILVDRVKAGDDSAFDALMLQYRRPILRFVFRIVGDAAEAEDLGQEVFVRAYRAMRKPAFRQTGVSFSAWIFQIARNAARDLLRLRHRHPADSLSVMEDDGASLPATGPTTPAEVTSNDVRHQIAAAVARLPEDQRTAFVLSEYEDQSTAVIAAVMHCSTKAVEARLYRARHILRHQLAHLLQ
jgi:RNA polymerase sigma-70 factor (ECF subfamily)